MTPVDHDALMLGDRLGSGGQGAVHLVLNRQINSRWPVAYKEYNAAARDSVDIDALTAMAELIPALPGATAEWLCTTAAWPAALVERQGRISGFLMRTVPDEYYFDYRSLDGTVARKPATAEFLLNSDSYTASIGLYIDERERLRLLADLAMKLSRLHALGIVVGDMSPKNLLFAPESGAGCFLIDCDAMRLNGRSVLPQAETPDWQVPAGEEKGTAGSDAYKLGLLAIRLFARNQTSRDPGLLPAAEPKLAELASAALLRPAGDRPAPGEWAEYCLSAAASPELAITPATDNTARDAETAAAGPFAAVARGQAAKSGLSARARQAIVAVAGVAVLAGVVIAAVAANSGGHTAADTGPASPSPSYSYTPPDTDSPTDPPSTPAPDPSSASPSPTPSTAPALLPSDFTDSDGESFTMVSTGPESCITKYQNATVQNILTQYNCVSQMVGSYVNDAGTILVSIQVMPMTDESTAQQVDSAMQQAAADGDLHSGDMGLWCPKSGTGSVCDSNYFSAATKEGWYGYTSQYFLDADAVWINLSQDTSSSAEDPLQAAAKAAVDTTQSQDYSGGQ